MSDTPSPSADEPRTFFHFRAGGVPMLCPGSAVEAVTSFETPVPLPRVPAHVLGLVTYDQRALVILDLEGFLHLDSESDAGLRRTLVVNAGPYRVGIPVERAFGIVSLAEEELDPAGDLFTGPLAEYVLGQASTDRVKGVSALLDLERLLEAARV